MTKVSKVFAKGTRFSMWGFSGQVLGSRVRGVVLGSGLGTYISFSWFYRHLPAAGGGGAVTVPLRVPKPYKP